MIEQTYIELYLYIYIYISTLQQQQNPLQKTMQNKPLTQYLLEAYNPNSQNSQFRKQKQYKLFSFLVVTIFEVGIIMLTFSVIFNNFILNVIGLGIFVVGIFVVLGIFWKLEGRQQEVDEEEKGFRVLWIGIFCMMALFMVLLIVTEAVDDYRYLLIGFQIAIPITGIPLILTIHNKKVLFFFRYILMMQIIFWYFYYLLNVLNSNIVHWGLVIYIGLTLLAFMVMLGIVQAEFGKYFISFFVMYWQGIGVYFFVGMVVEVWEETAPWVWMTLIMHLLYVVFLGSLWFKKPLQILTKLTQISNNILKQDPQNPAPAQQPLLLDHNLDHSCRMCLTNPSSFAFNCFQNFYHLCLCEECVVECLRNFHGNCQICGIRNEVVYRIVRLGNGREWGVVKKFDVANL